MGWSQGRIKSQHEQKLEIISKDIKRLADLTADGIQQYIEHISEEIKDGLAGGIQPLTNNLKVQQKLARAVCQASGVISKCFR